MLKTFGVRFSVLLPLVAASIPPALIAVTVARYGLNVPILDQWAFIPLLADAMEGKLRFEPLWAQHNEHRVMLPRLVMLALAGATDWDIRYELAANVVVALGLFAMLVLLLGLTLRPLAPALTPWLILAASLTTFSLTQWENWLWGWQLQVFMNALAAAVTVWALARWGPRWPGLAVALLAAAAGALSFTTGLILLAVVPLGLLLAPWRDQGAGRLLSVGVAAAVGVGVAVLYLSGFQYPVHRPTLSSLFAHPFSYGFYVLVYLGAGLGFWSVEAAAAWGAMGIVLFAWCGVWLWTRSPAHRPALLPWLLLSLYAILSGLLIAVGRIQFGGAQALSSRYVTTSALFWMSLVVVVALAITHFRERANVSRARARAVVMVTACLVMLAGVSYGVSWSHARGALKGQRRVLLLGQECLLHYRKAHDDCLRVFFPDVGIVRAFAHRLETLALGPFAPSKRDPPLSRYAVEVGSEAAGWINEVVVDDRRAAGIFRSGQVVVSGWAMDPFTRRAVSSVLVVVDGQVMGRAMTGRRAHMGTVPGQNRPLRSGWTFRFGLFRLDPGPHRVEAYALLDNERSIVALGGSRVIEGPR